MSDFTIAIILGFSFGNLWLCALLVFSLQTTNRNTCAGYLIGRAGSIVLLALVLSIIGKFVIIGKPYLNLASGLLLFGFAIYMALIHVFSWIPPWKRGKKETEDGLPDNSSCDGNCSSCPSQSEPEYAEACESCHDHGLCAGEEPEVEFLTREARKQKGKEVENDTRKGWIFGITLGAIRGTAMCAKLTVLFPILLSSSILKALGLGIVFSLSSSIYPILGFIFGSFALKLVKLKKVLFIISCIMLSGAGIHYFIKGITHL
jgi:hypothetical protein